MLFNTLGNLRVMIGIDPPRAQTMRELLPRLDAQQFWQIHRPAVVCADAIATAARGGPSNVALTPRGHTDKLVASRLYANLFKVM